MIDRLKVIMEKEALTPSQLADRLQIQRSGISHILSGRNNPSLDFVKKVLTEFPQYDMEWFIFGDTNVNSGIYNDVYKSEQPKELSLFSDDTNSDVIPQPKPTKLTTVNSNPPLSSPSGKEPTITKNPQPVASSEKTAEKQLVKVIMVYDNHTFEELKSEV